MRRYVCSLKMCDPCFCPHALVNVGFCNVPSLSGSVYSGTPFGCPGKVLATDSRLISFVSSSDILGPFGLSHLLSSSRISQLGTMHLSTFPVVFCTKSIFGKEWAPSLSLHSRYDDVEPPFLYHNLQHRCHFHYSSRCYC